ncbi:hypothetical protein SK128_027056 [Halocaridina rubra]|uniref:Uncharacterized protein n=1 Tax=Halocaridina rubra TaxID=373956 RepID=A0AAN8XDN7_HALRR
MQEDIEPNPSRWPKKPPYGDYMPQIPRDSIIDEKPPRSAFSVITTPEEQECQDLIPPGGERGGRNLSGDSGTSEVDQGDSSGCSTGGDSDASSASDRVHQSSDSGTVQEEPGFHTDGGKWGGSGSLRLRTPGPAYVRQGLPDGLLQIHSHPTRFQSFSFINISAD